MREMYEAFIVFIKSITYLYKVKWHVWWLDHHRERAKYHRKIVGSIVLYKRPETIKKETI